MNRLDDELKIALERREVSPDFTARVMARVAEMEPPPVSLRDRLVALFRVPAMQFAAAGVTLCLIVGLAAGGHYYREYQAMKEREEGRIAREQVLLAFQIASSKLSKARQKVTEVTERSEKTTAYDETGETVRTKAVADNPRSEKNREK